MLFEFFTVLLMKKVLFKIFFQNKYYEWWAEMDSLTTPPADQRSLTCCSRPLRTEMASGFLFLTPLPDFIGLADSNFPPLCSLQRPPRAIVRQLGEQVASLAGSPGSALRSPENTKACTTQCHVWWVPRNRRAGHLPSEPFFSVLEQSFLWDHMPISTFILPWQRLFVLEWYLFVHLFVGLFLVNSEVLVAF